MSCHQSGACLPITRQRKVAGTSKLAGNLSVPRLIFRTSSKRSKVKVTRPLWVAVHYYSSVAGDGAYCGGRTACSSLLTVVSIPLNLEAYHPRTYRTIGSCAQPALGTFTKVPTVCTFTDTSVYGNN